MGMHLKTVIMYGVKRTRKEWQESGVDLYEIQSEEIYYADSEGCKDMIVGKKLAETNVYIEQVIEEIIVPGVYETCVMLNDAGIACIEEDIKLYIMDCWG